LRMKAMTKGNGNPVNSPHRNAELRFKNLTCKTF
jgi:hypothetical protein